MSLFFSAFSPVLWFEKSSVVCESAARMESRLEIAAKIPARIKPRSPAGSSV